MLETKKLNKEKVIDELKKKIYKKQLEVNRLKDYIIQLSNVSANENKTILQDLELNDKLIALQKILSDKELEISQNNQIIYELQKHINSIVDSMSQSTAINPKSIMELKGKMIGDDNMSKRIEEIIQKERENDKKKEKEEYTNLIQELNELKSKKSEIETKKLELKDIIIELKKKSEILNENINRGQQELKCLDESYTEINKQIESIKNSNSQDENLQKIKKDNISELKNEIMVLREELAKKKEIKKKLKLEERNTKKTELLKKIELINKLKKDKQNMEDQIRKCILSIKEKGEQAI